MRLRARLVYKVPELTLCVVYFHFLRIHSMTAVDNQNIAGGIIRIVSAEFNLYGTGQTIV